MNSPSNPAEGVSESVWLIGVATFGAILTLVGLLAPSVAARVGLWLVIGVTALAALFALQSLTRRVLPHGTSVFLPDPDAPDDEPLPLHLEQLRPTETRRRAARPTSPTGRSSR